MQQSPNCVQGSKYGTGGSIGVLVAELESTEYSSSEDQVVDTDDSVELLEFGRRCECFQGG